MRTEPCQHCGHGQAWHDASTWEPNGTACAVHGCVCKKFEPVPHYVKMLRLMERHHDC